MKNNKKRLDNGGNGTAVGNALRWLVAQGKTIAEPLLKVAGGITGIEGLTELSSMISNSKELSDVDKEMLLKQLDNDIIRENEITKRWEADLHSDSWMSKNIRPMTLSFLLLNMFIFIILDSSLEGFKINPEWISLLKGLLMTAVGGYFLIRGAEKITNKFKG